MAVDNSSVALSAKSWSDDEVGPADAHIDGLRLMMVLVDIAKLTSQEAQSVER